MCALKESDRLATALAAALALGDAPLRLLQLLLTAPMQPWVLYHLAICRDMATQLARREGHSSPA